MRKQINIKQFNYLCTLNLHQSKYRYRNMSDAMTQSIQIPVDTQLNIVDQQHSNKSPLAIHRKRVNLMVNNFDLTI